MKELANALIVVFKQLPVNPYADSDPETVSIADVFYWAFQQKLITDETHTALTNLWMSGFDPKI